MSGTPHEETTPAAGGTEGGFPNKRPADGRRSTGEHMSTTSRSEAADMQLQKMGNFPGASSHASDAQPERNNEHARDSEDSEEHGSMDHMEEDADEKLTNARVYHRLASEGKLKYDPVGHGSEAFTGVIPTLRNILQEGSKDYFQQFHKLAKHRDGARAHTAESYKGFLQEKFASELTSDYELPGVTSRVYSCLLANYKTEGITERLRALEISRRKPGVGDSYTTQAEQDSFNEKKDAEEAASMAKAQELGWPKYQTPQKEQEVALKAEAAKSR
eukprot:3935596-Rhodomonas_salina.1